MSDLTPPVVDLDAERAVLSACLCYPERGVLDEVRSICRYHHFTLTLHREVFQTLEALADRGEPPDLVTLANDLRARGKWNTAVTSVDLAQLIDATPSVANVAAHARLVRDLYRVRRVATESRRITAEAEQMRGAVSEDVQSFLAQSEATFAELSEEAATSRLRPVSEVVRDVAALLQRTAQQRTAVTGVPLGFTALDQMLTGLQEGDLAILAARPGMGKTALGLCAALHAARAGYGVAFFSLEMPAEQLVLRLVSIQSGVALQLLRSGQLAPQEWVPITQALADLADLPLWIDDTAAASLAYVRSGVRRLQHEIAGGQHENVTRGLGLVIVDYLQLATPPRQSGSREQDIGELSRGCKRLAKECRLAVLLLSQLNREPEKRPDHRPRLSDLRESGSIEQDADVVMFVHRPEYYARSKDDEADEETYARGAAEIIVAKQRNGPTGKVFAAYRASTTEFRNLEPTPDFDGLDTYRPESSGRDGADP